MADEDISQELMSRAERIMTRERHRPSPYSTEGLEAASLIYDLAEALKCKSHEDPSTSNKP